MSITGTVSFEFKLGIFSGEEQLGLCKVVETRRVADPALDYRPQQLQVLRLNKLHLAYQHLISLLFNKSTLLLRSISTSTGMPEAPREILEIV